MRRQRTPTANLPARREASLNGVPYHLPTVKREEKPEEGKLYVTIQYKRPRWQQMLGAEELCDRAYGLDEYGRQVYELCNGNRRVRDIINKFAYDNSVSRPEAETAVTRFMHTMLSKGLIAMEMEKPDDE